MNRRTHAPIRSTFGKGYLSSSGSMMSSSMCAALKISLITFASDFLSGVDSRTRWTGHSAGLLNHDGPSFHNVFPETFPPRLPMSAGFSAVGTWCQVTFSCWRIFCTLFATNCRYSPWSLIQYRATVESSQQWIVAGWVVRACWMFVARSFFVGFYLYFFIFFLQSCVPIWDQDVECSSSASLSVTSSNQSLGNPISLFDYFIDNRTNAVWDRISESMQGDLLNSLMVWG
jgi:hypothetical protein